MAKKKVIRKHVKVKEEVVPEKTKAKKPTKGTKKSKPAKKSKAAKKNLEEDIDAFEVDANPTEESEQSELEKEIYDEGEEFEEEIQEERFYVIPLAHKGYDKVSVWRRAKKAIRVIREFLTHHMKPEGEPYLSQELNERVWERGARHPPRKVRVRVTKSVDGIVRAYLA